MDADRYQLIKEIYFEASQLEGAERQRYLDEACGEDPGLRTEVDRLMESDTVATGGIRPSFETPPPEACGPYRVGQEVGRGGMGIVYEATDERDGTVVAVKIVHPFVPVDKRIEREAVAGRSVDHPNVVRTLDSGSVDDRAYLVMEFVEGKDLRHLLEDLGTVPETLLREIAEQACAGLEAIHAADIVHRDLKPENILITDDQRVRIMDLGIAKLQGASIELTIAGQFIGSLNYAAPEQCKGDRVEPTADLYSLGVVLYELATGTNPFRHDNPGAVIRAHLDLVPPPATGVSPFFAAVLETLLQKAPRDRVATAAELARILDEGEEGDWWQVRRTGLGRPIINVRRDTRLYGREKELRVLFDGWEQARTGLGSSLLLHGEAGLGKSRVIDEFVRGVGEDAHILYGAFSPAGGMRGLSEAIESKFGPHLEERLAEHLSPALVPGLAALVRGEPETMSGDALQAMATRLMRSLATDQPVLWIMEDLHFAPEVARDIARAMAQAAREHRILFLVTSRKPHEGFVRLHLSRLSPDDAVAMLRELNAPEGVAEKSGGVPFFVLEIARSHSDEIPGAVRDLIAARLSDVGRDERAVLDVAAVCGVTFDADLVALALDMPVVTVLQHLAELERRRGVVRAAGRMYRFDHGLIQEVLHDELPPRLREEYHTLLAGALEGPAQDVCYHHLHGRSPTDALPLLDESLDFLRSRYLNEAALDMAERALPLVKGRDRARLLLRVAELLDRMGDRVRQLEFQNEARIEAENAGDLVLQVQARLDLAGLHATLAREEEALSHAEAACDLAVSTNDPSQEALALGRTATILARMRRLPEAVTKLERGLVIAREQDDVSREMVLMGIMGTVLRQQSRYADALAMFEQVIPLDQQHGRRDYECWHLGAKAIALYYLGRFEASRSAFEEYITLSEEIGNRSSMSAGIGNLAITLIGLGRTAEALEKARAHFRYTGEIGNRRGNAVALTSVGKIAALMGEFKEARTHLDAAVERAGDIGAPNLAVIALLARARLEELYGGDPRPDYERGLECARTVHDRDREARCLLGLGRVAEAKAIGEELELPFVLLFAALQEGDLETARDLLARDGDRILFGHRIEAHWRAGNKDKARELLKELQRHAPRDHRRSVLTAVPLFGEIAH